MTSPTPLEILIAALDPDGWVDQKLPGAKKKVLWEPEPGGFCIAVVKFAKGSGIPTKHSHASNQFFFCLSGRYSYPESGLVLEPGSFYCNPKDNVHGPSVALEDTVLIEIYDGPHYYTRPDYHYEDYTFSPGADA